MKIKKILIVLLRFSGINMFTSQKLLTKSGLNLHISINQFKNYIIYDKDFLIMFLSLIEIILKKFFFMKETIYLKFNLYKKIHNYKGKRPMFNLPLNGQRTHTNARTSKKLLRKSNA